MAGEATVGWDEFVAAVAGAANVPTDAIDRDTRLLEDLDVDSLALAEIVVVLLVDLEMASLASDLPAREWRHVTISELFDEYVSQEQPPARERYVIHRRP